MENNNSPQEYDEFDPKLQPWIISPSVHVIICAKCGHIHCACKEEDVSEPETDYIEYPQSPNVVQQSDVEEPYVREPNANENIINAVFGVYELWLHIAEYVGLVEMYACGRINTSFYAMSQLMIEDREYGIKLNQDFYRRALIGEDISDVEDARHYKILNIDMESRSILTVSNDGTENERIRCFRFSTILPRSSFLRVDDRDVTHFCGYCRRLWYFESYNKESHGVIGCQADLHHIKKEIKGLISIRLDQNHRISIGRLANLAERPQFMRPDRSVLEGLESVREFKAQRSTPTSSFVYTNKIFMGETSFDKQFLLRPLLWFDLPRMFDPKDNEARIIVKRMRITREKSMMADLKSTVRSIEEIRDFMDHIPTFEGIFDIPELCDAIMKYLGEKEIFNTLPRVNKNFNRLAHNFVEANWSNLVEPLYKEALLGFTFSKSEGSIRDIDFRQKVIFAGETNIFETRKVLSFKDKHEQIEYPYGNESYTIVCGYCFACYTHRQVEMWDDENPNTKCPFWESQKYRLEAMLDQKDMYIFDLHNVRTEAYSESYRKRTPDRGEYTFENRAIVEELEEVMRIDDLDKIPETEFVYTIRLNSNDSKSLISIGSAPVVVFAVGINRIFMERDWNTFRLIMTMKKIRDRMSVVGWKASLESLRRIRSALKEEGETFPIALINEIIEERRAKELREEEEKKRKEEAKKKKEEKKKKSKRQREEEEPTTKKKVKETEEKVRDLLDFNFM